MDVQITKPDIGITNALKFTWNNQGRILKLVAFPLLLMVAESFIDSSLMASGASVSKTIKTLAIIAYFLGLVIMNVRLFRFHLLDEDASKISFFSYGYQEAKTLVYFLLIGFLMFVILFLPRMVLNDTAAGVVILGVCLPFSLYMIFRLIFLFPAIAIDRPTSMSQAWGQMKGWTVSLFLTLLIAGLLMGLIMAVPEEIFILYLGIDGFTNNIIAQGVFDVYTLWATVISNSITCRLISNLYRFKVLDQE